MTRIVVSAVGVILWVGLVRAEAQTGVKATDPALQAAIDARENGIVARQTADWVKHTADDFVLINNRGEVENRETRLKLLTTTKNTGGPAVNESIRMYGADTAVLIQQRAATRAMTVWVRQGGLWKVVSTQITPIAK